MNTQHFRYALEVEKTGSITQAADNLYMGQPSLSKAIRELEDTLGITIFKRTSRGVVPTAKGAVFLKHAQNVLMQIQKMESLRRPDDPNRQTLSIAVAGSSYVYEAVAATVGGLDASRFLEIDMAEAGTIRTIQSVTEGRFDLGIIRYPLANEGYFLDFLAERGLKAEMIWSFEKLVVMKRTHPLANQMQISADDLSEYVEIFHAEPDAGPGIAESVDKYAESDHVRKRMTVYGWKQQFDLLRQMENAFTWASPVAQPLLEQYDMVQRKCLNLRQQYVDSLVYVQGHEFHALEKKLIDRLYESRNEVALKTYC